MKRMLHISHYSRVHCCCPFFFFLFFTSFHFNPFQQHHLQPLSVLTIIHINKYILSRKWWKIRGKRKLREIVECSWTDTWTEKKTQSMAFDLKINRSIFNSKRVAQFFCTLSFYHVSLSVFLVFVPLSHATNTHFAIFLFGLFFLCSKKKPQYIGREQRASREENKKESHLYKQSPEIKTTQIALHIAIMLMAITMMSTITKAVGGPTSKHFSLPHFFQCLCDAVVTAAAYIVMHRKNGQKHRFDYQAKAYYSHRHWFACNSQNTHVTSRTTVLRLLFVSTALKSNVLQQHTICKRALGLLMV